MTFKRAVELTPDLQGGWQEGLRALREIDRNRVDSEDTRRFRGSVDVESCLKSRRPLERQWDYAIGFQPTNLREEVIYWIEVHPANPGEVKDVRRKLEAGGPVLQDPLRFPLREAEMRILEVDS
jgi:hypothetical protein